MQSLLPMLEAPFGDAVALRFPEGELSYRELAQLTSELATELGDAERVAVWAEPRLETAVAVVAALTARAVVVPINPKAGEAELRHILADSAPSLLLAAEESPVSEQLASLRRIAVPSAPHAEAIAAMPAADPSQESLSAQSAQAPPGEQSALTPSDEQPALIVYTSGTTGPPKGVVLPRRALSCNLDALAEAWEWGSSDVVVQALPLFHVHGLVIGVLGPLRRGGTVWHLGRFDGGQVASALGGEGSMLFAVPTMYRRLADAAEADAEIATGLAGARLLVSGSAALPAAEHERIERLCGQRVVERYGMTETLMNTAVAASGERAPGYVGPALPGVQLRLVDDDGKELDPDDEEALGEIQVQGQSLFLEYLNRPEATTEAFSDSWFRTGDVASRRRDGYIRIVGRKATDLIKSGGFKIGAGEIEAALREHEGVQDAAVTGRPDPDLGEIVAAWIVLKPGASVSADDLVKHVTTMLASHKRPREVSFVSELPRNALGKVQKRSLLEL